MQMVGGKGGNHFRQYARQNVRNLNGYNVVQNVRNQVVQNVVQNLGVQNVGNKNRFIVLGIANQNVNQNGNGNVVAARAEGNGNGNGNNGNQQGLEYEIERLLKAVVSQHIMSTVQSNSIVDTSNLQECKYDKISYDKAYNDMQQKIERVQAQLGDFKGKSQDTSCVSDAFDPLSQKLEDKNVS
ncbi:hypothetical protein Tco_0760544 [Tanacetum coccineum]